MATAPPTWDEIRSVLDRVLDLPPNERNAFLESTTLDPALGEEVRAYLAYAFVREPVLDDIGTGARSLLGGLLNSNEERAWPEPGAVMGSYRLDRLRATGGAGAVYEATDLEAERPVAVKVLPALRPDVLDALRREVRALARLDHPNIARFLAASQTPDGTPFFAMELVEGRPITDAADALGLSTAARARLIKQCADALQHAHEHLVVHRDVKPANVLVADTPMGPWVKLVDFGIGRRLGLEDRDESLYLRLTPAYASPEQLRGESATVTSDVYSMGVLAYEVFTGVRPPEDLPLPSEVAPPERRAALRGDLDAIVLKALASEPSQRYATMADFRDDLVRARTHHEVMARPLGRWERGRRFARRHQREVVLAAATTFLILGLTGAYVTRLRHERLQTLREAATAEEVVAMLSDVFDAGDPYNDRTDTLRARTLVEMATRRFLTTPPRDAVVAARLACTLARVRTSLMDLNGADSLFDRCLATPPSPVPRWYVAAMRDRSTFQRERGDYARADSDARRAVDLARNTFGPRDLDVARGLSRQGDAFLGLTHADSAAAAYQQALDLYHALLGDSHLETAAAYDALGLSRTLQGRYDEAATLHRRALSLQRRLLGEGHVTIGKTLNNLGAAYSEASHYARADSAYRAAQAVLVLALGREHPSTDEPLMNLGVIYGRNGDFARATTLLDSVYRFRVRLLGPDHPQTLFAASSLGRIHSENGADARAVALLSDAHQRANRTLGPDHQTTTMINGNLGFVYIKMNDGPKAEAVFRDLLPRLDRTMGADHPMTAMTRIGLVDALVMQGEGVAAESIARPALAALQKALPPGHPQVLNAMGRLARTLGAQMRYADAEEVLRQRFDVAKQHYPTSHEQVQAAAGALGRILALQNRLAEAGQFDAMAGRFSRLTSASR